MSPLGTTEIQSILIAVLSLGAAWTDIRSGKIYNVWIMVFVLLGLFYGAFTGGFYGLTQSLAGLFIGLVMFLPAYLTKHMAGGDLKLLGAIGALTEVGFVLRTTILSILIGGVLAIFWMTFKRRWIDFFVRIQLRGLKSDTQLLDQTNKMPFGVAIAVAAVWLLVANPLEGLGMERWIVALLK